jgi:hypothetical protein
MTSTQLKKARKWMTQIQSLTGRGSSGNIFTLPIMSQIYQLRTVEERNDKGSWFGWEISRNRPLDLTGDERNIFELAVSFHKSVKSGEVKVKEEADAPAPSRSTDHDDGVM